ncbi:MAG: putative Starch synthase [Pelosinus sp.]|jgi:glycosyltransferase involved in cell wall biosynthesis|nr:putative Starch synthase [Pelosinus sp.]
MKVLITNTGPWGTGSGTVADAVMQELIKRGHEVVAFFPDLGLPGAEYDKYYGNKERYRIVPFPVEYEGVKLYTFPLIISDPNPRNYKHAWTFRDLTEVQLQAYLGYIKQELMKVLEEFQPDVIECQHIWAIDHILHELGYSYVAVAHHSDQLGFLYDTRMREYAIRSANNAKYIFAISDYVKQEVIDLYGVSSEKVISTSNGYKQSVFMELEINREEEMARFGLSKFKDLPLITFCGKVSKTKGIDVLLRANSLIQQRQKAVILVLGGGELDEICNEISDEYSMENVVYLGHRSQEDLAILHNLAKMSVLPSRTEGFGIAALESMACGIPIVATNVGGLAEFAVGGLVEPENHVLLAEAIIRILEMGDDQYQELCHKSLDKAHQYSWSSIVDTRLKYYEEMVLLEKYSNAKVI